MSEDITTLDQEAQRMSVLWDKAMNFLASFNHAFCENRKKFEAGIYPPEWHYNRWLLAKVGLSEKTCLRVTAAVAQYARLGDQERERERLAEINAEKKAERARIKAEKQATTERLAAARAARKAKEEQKAKPASAQITRPSQARKAQAPRQRKVKHDEVKREEAIEFLAARLRAGEPLRAYEKGKELSMGKGTMDSLVEAARERVKHNLVPADKPKTNGDNDPLAQLVRDGWIEMDRGREQWIGGVMKVAAGLAKARDLYPADQDFGDWLTSNKLERNAHDRAALIQMGRLDPDILRNLLKTSQRRSIQLIWRVFQNGRFASASKPAEASLPS